MNRLVHPAIRANPEGHSIGDKPIYQDYDGTQSVDHRRLPTSTLRLKLSDIKNSVAEILNLLILD
jgi:hypothetical protein